jgi:hypothetical protein
MRRRTLDALLTTGGLIVATVLLAAGGLLTWASSFVGNEVHAQLSAQHITFPAKGSEQLNDPQVKPYLEQYAGQQLTTGAQAKAYSDHFIKVHLAESTGGKTYSELSAAARANPDDPKAQGLVELAFKGETLRGLLLNAYAFGTMGMIAMYAAWGAFIGAAALFLLSGLGFVHLRRVPVEEEVGAGARHTRPVPAIA